MAVDPLVDDSMWTRRIQVPSKDVVFIKGVFEASYGVASVFAVRGGELTIAADPSQASEADAIVDELLIELQAR